MIDFTCPNCGEAISVPACLGGLEEACPGCKKNVAVPREDSPATASSSAPTAIDLPRLYDNSTYNLLVHYPANWEIVFENQTDPHGVWRKPVGLSGPSTHGSHPEFLVQVGDLLHTSMNIRGYMSKTQKDLAHSLSQYRHLNSREGKWRGHVSGTMLYTYRGETGPIKEMNTTVFLGAGGDTIPLQFIGEMPLSGSQAILPILLAMVDRVHVGSTGLRLPFILQSGKTRCDKCDAPFRNDQEPFSVFDLQRNRLVALCLTCTGISQAEARTMRWNTDAPRAGATLSQNTALAGMVAMSEPLSVPAADPPASAHFGVSLAELAGISEDAINEDILSIEVYPCLSRAAGPKSPPPS